MRRPAGKTPGHAGPGPIVLGIESATPFGGVALADAGGLLGEITLRSAESHSERLLPAVARLLEALGVALDAVAAVAVSSGPGSFTGLRTGIAAAKGLALARGVPLYGVPTLEALARNAAGGPTPVAALVNARRGEYFRAVFVPGARGPALLGPEHLVPAAAVLAGLPPECLVVGEVPAGAADARPPAGGPHLASPHLRHPRAEVIARAGLDLLLRGAPSELETLLPRYLRAPDAKLPGRPAPAGICLR